jgi:hypothetical protein
MDQIAVSKISNRVIHNKERDISCVIERCLEDRQCTPTPNRVDVFGTGTTLPGRADVSQAAAGPRRLQLCAVLGCSGINLSEYICTSRNLPYFVRTFLRLIYIVITKHTYIRSGTVTDIMTRRIFLTLLRSIFEPISKPRHTEVSVVCKVLEKPTTIFVNR